MKEIQTQLKWNTIPLFKDKCEINMYHKEKEKVTLPFEEIKNLHVLTRTYFNVQELEEEYILKISADDYYKLYINGQYVGQGPAPAYPEHYY